MLVLAIKRLAIWLAFAFVLLNVFHPLLKFLMSLVVPLVIFLVCGQSMQYKNLEWHGKNIIVSAPYFKNGSFAAETLSLSFSMQENTFFPVLTLAIQNPKFYVDSESIEKWRKFFFHKNNWFRAFLDIEVENGWMGWHTDQGLHQFTFECKPRFRNEKLLHIYLSSNEAKKNLLSLSFINEATNLVSVQADLQDVDNSALQYLLRLIYSEKYEWDVFSGCCSGRIKMNVPYRSIKGILEIEQLSLATIDRNVYTYIPKCTLSVEKNSLSNLEKKTPLMGIWRLQEPAYCAIFTPFFSCCANVIGTGSFQFGNTLNQSLTEGDFLLSNNYCYFPKAASFFYSENIIHVSLQKKCAFTSQAHFLYENLKGEATIDWKKNHATFLVETDFSQLKEFFPISTKCHLQTQFSPQIILDGQVQRNHKGCEATGNIKLLASPTPIPAINFEARWEEEMSLSDAFCMSLGCKKIPLYLLTNIFSSLNGIHMEGLADMHIALDPRCLSLQYEVSKPIIENGAFQFTCLPSKEEDFSVMSGNYRIDFMTKQQRGTLPIQNGQLFIKNNALYMSEIEGVFIHDGASFSLQNGKGYCENFFYAGSVEYKSKQPIPQLYINIPQFFGKISSLQNIIARLNCFSLLHDLSLEGEISHSQNGLECTIDFHPDNHQVKIAIQANLQEGTLQVDSIDASLKELSAEISYHYPEEILNCSNIQASLLVGRASCMKEYPCIGRYVRFWRLKDSNIEWDIAIYDDTRECVRLVGYSQDERLGVKEIKLDPFVSHISSFYLEDWQCYTNHWSTLKRLNCKGYFDLENLYEEIKKVPLEMSRLFLQFIRHKNISIIKGIGLYTIVYDALEEQFTYQLSCSSIQLENFTETHNGLFKIRQQSNKWMLDELRWDEWCLCAEIEPLSHKLWKVPFLGISHEKNFLMGIEGVLLLEKEVFSGQIKYSQLDLGFLSQNLWSNALATLTLKGHIELLGEFEWNYLSEVNSLQFKGRGNLNSFQLNERMFFTSQSLEISYINQKYYIEKLSTDFFSKQREGGIHIFELQLSEKLEVHYLKGALHIASHKLGELTDWLQLCFSRYLPPSFLRIFLEGKKDEEVKADFIFENHANNPLLSIQIADGMFSFSKQKYLSQNTRISISAKKFYFSSFIVLPLKPCQMRFEAFFPSFEGGSCTLHEDNSSNPLKIVWKQTLTEEFALESIQGEFSGCIMNLKKDDSRQIKKNTQNGMSNQLQGEVSIPIRILAKFLNLPIKINFSLFLKGYFWIPINIENFWQRLHFFGTAYNHISKKKQATANVEYWQENIKIKDFCFQNNQESINIPNIFLYLKAKKWDFYIPTLTMKKIHLSTLGYLVSFIPPTKAFDSLLFKKITLEEVRGECQNVITWKGKGSVHFVRPTKNECLESLLSLPLQQLLKMGVTPQSLQPVTGIIELCLKENRVYLIKLKNCFNEGRSIKFSLNKENSPFWIDLEGELFMQLRIKTNHSLFRTRESFLLSLDGSIIKPRYTINPSSNR